MICDVGYLFVIVLFGGCEDLDVLFFNSCKFCIKYIDYGSFGIFGIYLCMLVYEDVIMYCWMVLLVDNNVDDW